VPGNHCLCFLVSLHGQDISPPCLRAMFDDDLFTDELSVQTLLWVWWDYTWPVKLSLKVGFVSVVPEQMGYFGQFWIAAFKN
jgi:hypothetical protein